MRTNILFLLMTITLSVNAKKWDTVYIDKLLRQGASDKVLAYYLEVYPQSVSASQIAALYLFMKNYPQAINWFEKDTSLLLTSTKDRQDYAKACMQIAACDRFKDFFRPFMSTLSDTASIQFLSEQCEQIVQSTFNMSAYEFENYTYNSLQDEQYISILRNHPVFVRASTVGMPFVWQIVRQYQQFAPPIPVYKNNAAHLNIISVSFSKDGNTVAFSATEQDKTSPRIYLADYLGGQLLNIRLFPYYEEGSMQLTPALNAKANELYFSSNQSGGFGKNDIWISKRVNGQWTMPENAGAIVNSIASEQSPYLVSDVQEHLYFASDKMGGVGGFDLYKATRQDGNWIASEWLPVPINSAADEMSIVYDPVVKTGYFTSNRTGGKGGFDIYRYIPLHITMQLQVMDTLHQPVPFSLWKITEENKLIAEGITDKQGVAYITTSRKKKVDIQVSQEKYVSAQQIVSLERIGMGDTASVQILLAQLPLVLSNEVVAPESTPTVSNVVPTVMQLHGRIVDSLSLQPVKGIILRMFNLTSRKIREVEVDNDGRFQISLLKGQQYEWILKTPEKEWQILYSTQNGEFKPSVNIDIYCGEKEAVMKQTQF